MPSSAMRCMSQVRIWISTGSPLGPITVVWSDWYMLTLGIAMKSVKRPGTGFQSECTTPRAPEQSRTEPVMAEGGVDVERLLGDLAGLLGRQVVERPHVVEAIGQLDHQHAQVARHRHQHLAEVLGLPLLARGEGQLADLGHAVHQLGDLLA